MSVGNRRRGPKPGGIEIYTGPYGETTEVETFTCGHCQHIIAVPMGQRELRHPCWGCQQLICGPCRNKPCFPAEKMAELEERIARITGESSPMEQIARDVEIERQLRQMGLR